MMTSRASGHVALQEAKASSRSCDPSSREVADRAYDEGIRGNPRTSRAFSRACGGVSAPHIDAMPDHFEGRGSRRRDTAMLSATAWDTAMTLAFDRNVQAFDQ